MPDLAEVSSVERLHDLATEYLTGASTERTSPLSETEATAVHHINGDMQLVREGGVLVVWGQLVTTSASEGTDKVLYTISFDGDSTEPTTFLRWNETRRDNGEGYSVPKRKREKVAKQLVDWLAVAWPQETGVF